MDPYTLLPYDPTQALCTHATTYSPPGHRPAAEARPLPSSLPCCQGTAPPSSLCSSAPAALQDLASHTPPRPRAPAPTFQPALHQPPLLGQPDPPPPPSSPPPACSSSTWPPLANLASLTLLGPSISPLSSTTCTSPRPQAQPHIPRSPYRQIAKIKRHDLPSTSKV